MKTINFAILARAAATTTTTRSFAFIGDIIHQPLRGLNQRDRHRPSSALFYWPERMMEVKNFFASAELLTTRTLPSTKVVLQLGTVDGRAITFLPKSVATLITSSMEPDGCLTQSAKQSLKEMEEGVLAAGDDGPRVMYVDQRADDLRETPDASVDQVISLDATDFMIENGYDWKKSIREAARVLKPGGRFLFVEPKRLPETRFKYYVDYIESLTKPKTPPTNEDDDNHDNQTVENEESVESSSESASSSTVVFEYYTYREVQSLFPHVAGHAKKLD